MGFIPLVTRVESTLQKYSGSYTLTGFFWVFKIWIFEAFPHMRGYATKKHENLIPRAISWEQIAARERIREDAWCRIRDVEDSPLRTLTPTEEEAATDWWKASRRFFDGVDAEEDSRDGAVKPIESSMIEVDIHGGDMQAQLIKSSTLEETCKDQEKEIALLNQKLEEMRISRETEISILKNANQKLEKMHISRETEISILKNANQKLEEMCISREKEISLLKNANQKLEMDVKSLEDKLRAKDSEIFNSPTSRKELRNTIMDLKGAIRVFCRVRSLPPSDDVKAKEVVSYPTGVKSGQGIDFIKDGKKLSFMFDKVFASDASQQDVFIEISQLVQSALDGYKICIFAYGQTGSGKTYTMMGRPEDPLQIPRSLELVYKTSQDLADQGWIFKMQVSMLEIYNETIRDLLRAQSIGGVVLPTEVSGAWKRAGKQAIRFDEEGNIFVPSVSTFEVCSYSEVFELLQQAAQKRSVGKTEMNEHSSRSHFVFILSIHGVHESTKKQVQGVLNLNDLAGSERISSTGERLKETQAINLSLLGLGSVLSAITSKSKQSKETHVPFRNSMLTALLEPCLKEDSEALFFCQYIT